MRTFYRRREVYAVLYMGMAMVIGMTALLHIILLVLIVRISVLIIVTFCPLYFLVLRNEVLFML